MRKKFLYSLLTAVFLCLFSFTIRGQSNTTNAGTQQKTSIKSEREKRSADKKKWKEERRRKRLEEKMILDHHKRIQTKAVNKRMRKSKRKAARVNENKREFFLIRWFSKH